MEDIHILKQVVFHIQKAIENLRNYDKLDDEYYELQKIEDTVSDELNKKENILTIHKENYKEFDN